MLATLRDRLLILCLAATVAAFGFLPVSAGAVAQNCVAPGLFDFYADVPIPLSGPGSLMVGQTGSYSLDLDFAAIGATAGNAAGTGRNISGTIAFPDGVDVTNIAASGPGGASASLSGNQLVMTAPGPITIPPYPKFTITFDMTPTSAGDKTIRSVSGSLQGNLTAPMTINATVTCKAVSDASRGATTAIRTIQVSGQAPATTQATQPKANEPAVENVGSTGQPAAGAGSSSTAAANGTTTAPAANNNSTASSSANTATTPKGGSGSSSSTAAAGTGNSASGSTSGSTSSTSKGSASKGSSTTGSGSADSSQVASSAASGSNLASTGASSSQTALMGLLLVALGGGLLYLLISSRRTVDSEQ
jgi:hypothetical protein